MLRIADSSAAIRILILVIFVKLRLLTNKPLPRAFDAPRDRLFVTVPERDLPRFDHEPNTRATLCCVEATFATDFRVTERLDSPFGGPFIACNGRNAT